MSVWSVWVFSARCKDFRLTRIETLLLQVTLGNDDDDGYDDDDVDDDNDDDEIYMFDSDPGEDQLIQAILHA